MLVDREQDYCLTCRPGTILIGVSAGDRIFVIDAPARDTIDIPAQCRDAAEADTLPRTVSEAYRRSGNGDTSSLNQSMRAEDQQDADLRHCYGTTVGTDPRFSRLVAQGRELVEILPDR